MLSKNRLGFTLIELSLVLVIVGLIIGGILIGRDLIEAATVRAQISQIEKYQSAVKAFRTKYNCLPGDCATAADFGFTARGTAPGQGDGNGALEGYQGPGFAASGYIQNGEPTLFWSDLGDAQLIAGKYVSDAVGGTLWNVPPDGVIPKAAVGRGNYVTTYSGSWWASSNCWPCGDHNNYLSLAAVRDYPGNGWIESIPGLSVRQAYAIDSKIDDGLPQSGRVMAMYLGQQHFVWWAAGGGTYGSAISGAATAWDAPTTAATAGSSTTCYDNNNVNNTPQLYSMGQSGGDGVNCALSFQFQ